MPSKLFTGSYCTYGHVIVWSKDYIHEIYRALIHSKVDKSTTGTYVVISLSTHLQKDNLSLTVDNVWVIKVTFTSEEALGSRRQNIARWTIGCYQGEVISSHDLESRRGIKGLSIRKGHSHNCIVVKGDPIQQHELI